MDLGSVISRVSGKLSGENHPNESYLAVKISSQSVLAAAWVIAEGKVIVGQIGSGDISSGDWEGLLKGADQAISAALPGESANPAKTIFAVPFDWVAGGKIDASHLSDLRRLCKELDLSPQGFVVTNEALANYYKEAEGAPLSAILIGVDGQNGFLSVYRAGVNLDTVAFGWSGSEIAPAVEKVLKNLTQVEVLPSRIIVYDGREDLEKIAQTLTAHPWTKQLPFLHFPKVETIPAESAVRAVAVAGGVEMGGKFELTSDNEPVGSKAPAPPGVASGASESEAELIPELEEVSLEEAGFATEDTLSEEPIVTPEISRTAVSDAVSKPAFGQIHDLSSTATPQATNDRSMPKIDLSGILTMLSLGSGKIVSRLRNLFSGVLPKGMSDSGSQPKFKAAFVVTPILILICLAALFYFAPRVTVIIKVIPKPFDRETEVVIVTDDAKTVATSSATLLGSFINVSEIGTKKGVASGRKLVGDKAKGTVTIYSASSARIFPQGTVLTSVDGIKFTLDHDTTIASASDFLSPATINATVTASGIGDSYNLPSGTKFTVSGLSSSQYLAKNDSSFTGGNSHQATVVTKDDQDRLTATLSAELTEKARSDLQSQVPPGQNLLPNAMTTTVSKKKFSKDVDAEADTVSLDLAVDYRGIIFSQADLVAVFVTKFSTDIPSGFTLSPELTRVEVKGAKNDKSGNSVLRVHLVGDLLPMIDKTTLANQISGKSLSQAQSVINGLPSVAAVVVDTQPRALSFVNGFFLPWKKENIKIDIVRE